MAETVKHSRAETRANPRLLQETATGRLTVRQVFPPRRALARGRGATLLASIALVSFALVFAYVRRNLGGRFDLQATLRLQRVRLPLFDRVMHAVSWPGFPPQSRIIPILLSATWLALGFPMEAAFQLLAWGAGAVSTLFKRIMGRPRPDPAAVRVIPARIGGSSFPSGHVLIYSGVYGFCAFLLETLVRPAKIRRSLIALLMGMITLVGPSRMYLGHHWFTDVVASYLLGVTYLLSLMALYRRVKTRWLNRGR